MSMLPSGLPNPARPVQLVERAARKRGIEGQWVPALRVSWNWHIFLNYVGGGFPDDTNTARSSSDHGRLCLLKSVVDAALQGFQNVDQLYRFHPPLGVRW